jgi:hypothetical protein
MGYAEQRHNTSEDEAENTESEDRIIGLSLEYKKGESQTNIEISKEDDWNKILQIEEGR